MLITPNLSLEEHKKKSLIPYYVTTGTQYVASCAAHLWDPSAQPEPDRDGKRSPLALYETRPLQPALSESYSTDKAFCTWFVLQRDGRLVRTPPRIRKDHLSAIRSHGFTIVHTVQVADFDMVGHARLTPAVAVEVSRLLSREPVGHYFTRAGFRIYRLLSRPLLPEHYEVAQQRWFAELRKLLEPVAQISIDASCGEWTRLMRLPRVVRDGVKMWNTEVQDANLTPIDPGDCTPPPPPPTVWRPKPVRLSSDHPVALSRLDRACDALARAPEGQRNTTLAKKAFSMGTLVGAGALSESLALQRLADACYGWDDSERWRRATMRTLEGCLRRGAEHPATDLPERFDAAALQARIDRIIRPDLARDGIAVEEV